MFHNGGCHGKSNECWEKKSLVDLGRFFCPTFSLFDSIFLTEPGNCFILILGIKTCPTSRWTLLIICSVRFDLVWQKLCMLTFVMYLATRKPMEFVRWTWLEKYYSTFITLEKSVFYHFVRETHPGAFSIVSRLQSKALMLKLYFELQDIRICIWMEATGNYFRMENIRKKWFSIGHFSGLSYYFDYLYSEVRVVSKPKPASESLLNRLS